MPPPRARRLLRVGRSGGRGPYGVPQGTDPRQGGFLAPPVLLPPRVAQRPALPGARAGAGRAEHVPLAHHHRQEGCRPLGGRVAAGAGVQTQRGGHRRRALHPRPPGGGAAVDEREHAAPQAAPGPQPPRRQARLPRVPGCDGRVVAHHDEQRAPHAPRRRAPRGMVRGAGQSGGARVGRARADARGAGQGPRPPRDPRQPPPQGAGGRRVGRGCTVDAADRAPRADRVRAADHGGGARVPQGVARGGVRCQVRRRPRGPHHKDAQHLATALGGDCVAQGGARGAAEGGGGGPGDGALDIPGVSSGDDRVVRGEPPWQTLSPGSAGAGVEARARRRVPLPLRAPLRGAHLAARRGASQQTRPAHLPRVRRPVVRAGARGGASAQGLHPPGPAVPGARDPVGAARVEGRDRVHARILRAR
mmetsp:Transcript_20279/g.49013  ORF Transcript_20279/g.49013 Transcript_20279/m.49013 type:complete len:419 (-) Transcript_20279:279-1535(-)